MNKNKLDKLPQALRAVQHAVGGITKDQVNTHFRNKYANLNAVLDGIRIPLHDNGFYFTQPIRVTLDGRMVLTTYLFHESGEHIQSEMMIPDENKPALVGSAISYFRRYSLMSLLGLPTYDDDGAEAEKQGAINQQLSARVTQAEAIEFEENLNKVPEFRDKINAYMRDRLNVTSYAGLQRTTYEKWNTRLQEELDKTTGAQ